MTLTLGVVPIELRKAERLSALSLFSVSTRNPGYTRGTVRKEAKQEQLLQLPARSTCARASHARFASKWPSG